MFWIYLLVGVLVLLVLRTLSFAPSSAHTAPLSRRQAAEILGIPEDADEDAIRDAHKRLMKKLHPDHGGSDYLSQQINQARDRLLKP